MYIHFVLCFIFCIQYNLHVSEVKGNEVKCSVEKGCKRAVMGRVYMGGKVVRNEGLGVKIVCAI
jgi:hypothetical protein